MAVGPALLAQLYVEAQLGSHPRPFLRQNTRRAAPSGPGRSYAQSERRDLATMARPPRDYCHRPPISGAARSQESGPVLAALAGRGAPPGLNTPVGAAAGGLKECGAGLPRFFFLLAPAIAIISGTCVGKCPPCRSRPPCGSPSASIAPPRPPRSCPDPPRLRLTALSVEAAPLADVLVEHARNSSNRS